MRSLNKRLKIELFSSFCSHSVTEFLFLQVPSWCDRRCQYYWHSVLICMPSIRVLETGERSGDSSSKAHGRKSRAGTCSDRADMHRDSSRVSWLGFMVERHGFCKTTVGRLRIKARRPEFGAQCQHSNYCSYWEFGSQSHMHNLGKHGNFKKQSSSCELVLGEQPRARERERERLSQLISVSLRSNGICMDLWWDHAHRNSSSKTLRLVWGKAPIPYP